MGEMHPPGGRSCKLLPRLKINDFMVPGRKSGGGVVSVVVDSMLRHLSTMPLLPCLLLLWCCKSCCWVLLLCFMYLVPHFWSVLFFRCLSVSLPLLLLSVGHPGFLLFAASLAAAQLTAFLCVYHEMHGNYT